MTDREIFMIGGANIYNVENVPITRPSLGFECFAPALKIDYPIEGVYNENREKIGVISEGKKLLFDTPEFKNATWANTPAEIEILKK